jgi:hypothetical protein
MAAAGPLAGAALLLLLERHQAAGASARHLRTVVCSAASVQLEQLFSDCSTSAVQPRSRLRKSSAHNIAAALQYKLA